ncbi:zinc finger protein 469-like [Microcaecilia unicolor]|uniref:Zinc finger protein 469-like n=1 Tax=Microcaecilia unicolor TaxID=1415580 RepID=A0A6P7YBK8_9AMPH|nr:zinc finger protein 469-like [Microcaecilia unicolor]
MTGEMKHAYLINETDASCKDHQNDFTFEQLSDPVAKGSRLQNGTDGVKHKQPHSQREAVIRPQQTGKIDFKSLQNRSRFSHDGTWNNGKNCPQSPTGKNRTRERNKRLGKGDRSQHQLYGLSITNPRANPTIGIAYPQQKVTPPKKPEPSPAPLAGSYQFHVPSLPDQEAELQQEDLHFRRFQEASSGHYTSPSGVVSHQHPILKAQQRESPSVSSGPLNYLDFQANRTSAWHSADKNFSAADHGISNQKSCSFPENSKSGSHCFGSSPLQYPFQTLQDEVVNSFCSHVNGQDYVDVTLQNTQVVHAAFPFHTPSRDGQEEPLGNSSYDSLVTDSRNYNPPSQLSCLVRSQTQGSQCQNSMSCYKGRKDHSTEMEGAISSSGAINPGAIDHTASTFQETPPGFTSSEFSLHSNSNSMPTSANKRQSTPKDGMPSQRHLDLGGSLRRNIPHNSLAHMHFQTKVYSNSSVNGLNAGAVSFESSVPATAQNHPRTLQAWDGGSTPFTSVDQTSAPYPRLNGAQLPSQSHLSAEQRAVLKNVRMPWQQVHLTSARVDLSRQLGSQKLPFPEGTSEWQGSSKIQKSTPLNNPPGYHHKKHLTGDHRNDMAQHNCNCNHFFPYESGKDSSTSVCEENMLLGMNQSICPRNNSNPILPPVGLVAVSPGESPLPSPITNGPCPSLSPVSSSPTNTSSEESQLPVTLTPSFFFHQGCYSKDGKIFSSSDPVNSSSLHYHEPVSTFSFSSDSPKDEHLFKFLQENQFQKQNAELAKGCLESFENEPPPPPPPYSSHHLLANSLSSANLDQLDVLLTCKQCDQNYSNLISFLEHRQYCGAHSVFQAEMRDATRVAESRKHSVDPMKPSQVAPGLPLSKGTSDPNSHLLALNKNTDVLLDGENKLEAKDDPLKVNIFSGLTNSLPLNTFDLEIDDAKLDSLITEALNGLGYQSDNPEIDSSFIDVFADEELSSIKGTGVGQPYKVKESLTSEKKFGPTELNDNRLFQAKTAYHDEDNQNILHTKNRVLGIKNGDKKMLAPKFAQSETPKMEKPGIKERPQKNVVGHLLHKTKEPGKTTELKMEKKSSNSPEVPTTDSQAHLGSSTKKQPKNKCPSTCQKTEARLSSTELDITNESLKLRRVSVKDMKKRKPCSGTWSKELIHKIVQQKNKLHKLHVKSNRSLQFSLVTERLLPKSQNTAFGEYDYISDSDDDKEYARMQAKKQLNGRLRYSFTRKHQESDGTMNEKDSIWRCSKKAEFEDTKKKDYFTEMTGRPSSQSSISNDQSTSINSPKNSRKTNSDNENQAVVNDSHQLTPIEGDPTKSLKDASKESQVTETDILKEIKKVGSASLPHSSSKGFDGRTNIPLIKYTNKNISPSDKEDQYDSKDPVIESPLGTAYTEEQGADTIQTASVSIAISQGEYSAHELMVHDSISQSFPPYNDNIIGSRTEGLISSTHLTNDINCDINANYGESGIKYLNKDQKDFGASAGCYNGDSTSVNLTVEGHGSYGNANNTTVYEQKDLASYDDANLFSKPLVLESPRISDLYFCSSDISANLFEEKHSDITPNAVKNEQRKMASPLGFDPSSIFGEIPVPEFDSPLYDHISTSQNNHVSYTCENNQTSKPTLFEQPYSQFLEEKDWRLVEDVSPVLSEDVPHFHDIPVEKAVSKKPADEGPGPPSETPLGLPERISGCNMSFMTNISDDELEIKRLVTELESQLQTNKINSNTAVVQPHSDQNTRAEPRETSGQLSPGDRGHADEEDKDLFLANATSLVPVKSCIGQNLGGRKLSVPKESSDYETQNHSWERSDELGSLESRIHMLIPQASKKESSSFQDALNEAEVTKDMDSETVSNESSSIFPDSCLSDTSDKSANQNYTTGLSNSPTVTSDALFPKRTDNLELSSEDPLPSLHSRPTENTLPKHSILEETCVETSVSGKFGNQLSTPRPKFNLQSEAVPVIHITPFTCIENVTDPEEKSFGKVGEFDGLQTAIGLKVVNSSSICNDIKKQTDPTTCTTTHLKRYMSNTKRTLFDASSADDQEVCTEDPKMSEDCVANPLQELQLFVARTVNNSKEELIVSCFPVLHSTTEQNANMCVSPEVRSYEPCSSEGEIASDNRTDLLSDKDSSLNKLKVASTQLESTEPQNFSDTSEQRRTLFSAKSSTAKLAESLNHDLQNNVTESHHLGDECSDLNDINIKADGVSLEDNNRLSFSSGTVNLLLGQATKDDQMENLLEKDNKKAALTFEKQRPSAQASRILFEKDSRKDAAMEQTVDINDADCSPSCDKLDPIFPLSEPGNVQGGPQAASLHLALSDLCSPGVLCKDQEQEVSKLATKRNTPPPSAEITESSLKEIHQNDWYSEDSSIPVPFLNNIIYAKEEPLQHSKPEHEEDASGLQVQLPEDDKFRAFMPDTMHLQNPKFVGQLSHGSLKENLDQETELSPFSEQEANLGGVLPESSSHISHCLGESPLRATESSEQDLLGELPASLCPSSDRCLPLDSEQRPDLPKKSCASPSRPPIEQNNMAQWLTNCDRSELECNLYENTAASSITDTLSSPQPVSAGHSPVQSGNYSPLSPDLFIERKDSTKLNLHPEPENQFENCSSSKAVKNEHNSLAEIVKSHFLHQQEETLSSTNKAETNSTVSQFPNVTEEKTNNAPDYVKNTERKLQSNDHSESGTENTEAIESGVLSILDSEKSKEILENLSRSGQRIENKSNGLQVTCNICSVSFRSKPGLMRHKAVKHQIKSGSESLIEKIDQSGLIVPEKTLKMAKGTSKKLQSTKVKMKLLKSANSAHGNLLKDESPDLEHRIKEDNLPGTSNEFNKESTSPDELTTTNTVRETSKFNSQAVESQQLHDPVEQDVPKQLRAKREKMTRSSTKDIPAFKETVENTFHGRRKRKKKMLTTKSSDSEKNMDDLSSETILNIIKTNILNAIVCPKQPSKLTVPELEDQASPLQFSYKVTRLNDKSQIPDDVGECLSSKDRMNPDSCHEQYKGMEQNKDGWSNDFVDHLDKNVNSMCEEQLVLGDGSKEGETSNLEEESNWMTPNEAATLGPTKTQTESTELAKAETLKEVLEGNLEYSPQFTERKTWENQNSPVAPVLQSLFDDECTFSQLFPQDNQRIRRKCTRVYGKRPKKQTNVVEVKTRATDPKATFSSQSSSSEEQKNDSCQNGTNSVNEDLMLDMCQYSKQKLNEVISSISESTTLQLEYSEDNPSNKAIDIDDDTMLTFLCQNSQLDKISDLHGPSAIQEREDLPMEILLDSRTELNVGHSYQSLSPEIPDLGEPYGGKIQEDADAADFQITFEMSEKAVFSSCREETEQSSASSTSNTRPKTSQRFKQNRNKADEGKMTKSQSDHIKTKDKQYKCKVCFQWFRTLGELDFHKLSHNPSPPPTCYMCIQRKFSSREQLRDHLREKHAKNKAGLWICGMCLKGISDVWMYNEHLREHASQFARKGQAQKSVMGLAGCFDEDSAVRTLQSTIIFRKISKFSKQADSGSRGPGSKSNKALKHHQEVHDSKTSKEPLDNNIQSKGVLTEEATPSSPPQHLENSERHVGQKHALIHPLCKDPSRDCHHCGKCFPKPFKLQRHLVVHSSQKIYLCHRCPMLYQDTQDLRSHLKREHNIAEVPEIKHTTLYACELCADVMHVIKKSFICSTCNYTFSKKEQYDRHMDKHLEGGNKTFKFRGVMRPGFSLKEGNGKVKEGTPSQFMPPSKKRKVGDDSNSSAPAGASLHVNYKTNLDLCPTPLPPSNQFVPEAIKDLTEPESETLVKKEEATALSDLPAERETSPECCLTPQMLKVVKSDPELENITTLPGEEMAKEDLDLNSNVPFADPFGSIQDTADLEKAILDQNADKHKRPQGQAKSPPNNAGEKVTCTENHSSLDETTEEDPGHQLLKKSCVLLEPGAGESKTKELQKPPSGNLGINGTTHENALKSKTAEGALPLKDRTASSDLNSTCRDSGPQKKSLVSQANSRSTSGLQSTAYNAEDPLKSYSVKEKAPFEMGQYARDGQAYNTKETGSNQSKSVGSQFKIEGAITSAKHSHLDSDKSSEKQALNASPKVCGKKRKEHKVLASKGSSASRENIQSDCKKKKPHTLGSGRVESVGGLKKPVQTNDPLCNRIQPKLRTGGHFRKVVTETHNQKKMSTHHPNGAYKQRKDILGKSIHQLLPKTTSDSSNRHRARQPAKPAEPHNYRTAESQNNLLSKLFGQRLTSFKIPLRRDTSD